MTVRDHLRRGKRRAHLVMWAPVVLLFLVVAIDGPRPEPISKTWPYVLGLMVLMCTLVVWTLRWMACPRCGYDLSRLSIRPRKKHQVNLCPHCELALDGPLPQGEPGA